MNKFEQKEDIDLADIPDSEHFDAMIELVQDSQKIALGLTEIILKHCKFDRLNEEKVFEIFSKAARVSIEALESNSNINKDCSAIQDPLKLEEEVTFL